MSVYVPATYNSVTVFFVVDCVPATNWAPPWWNHEANGNCEWDLFWSGLSTLGWLVADVSRQPICLRFRGQDVTYKLSRNVADIHYAATQKGEDLDDTASKAWNVTKPWTLRSVSVDSIELSNVGFSSDNNSVCVCVCVYRFCNLWVFW